MLWDRAELTEIETEGEWKSKEMNKFQKDEIKKKENETFFMIHSLEQERLSDWVYSGISSDQSVEWNILLILENKKVELFSFSPENALESQPSFRGRSQ